jgi:thiamine pyrophosphokinase
MTITLIGNGAFSDCTESAQQSDMVIAVDGGARHCLAAGVVPDLIIGDGDSLSEDVRKQFDSVELVRDTDQNSSDVQKALAYVSTKQAELIHLHSFTSNDRLDHSLTAVMLLRTYQDLPLVLHGPGWTARYLTGHTTLTGLAGETVSCIPLGHSSGVESVGLQWELSDAVLSTRTVSLSNVVTQDPCAITVGTGGILFIHNTQL